MSDRATPWASVVVPIHNEADFLPTGLPQLYRALEHAPGPVEVLLVENGSIDATAEIAERLGDPRTRVLRLPVADYGEAMAHGFAEARGDWVVNFDIDYISGAFLAGLPAFEDEADVVIASKRDPGSEDRRSAFRRLATFGFNLLLRTLFGSRVSDTHGIKAFRREVVAAHLPAVVSRQDLFDTELVLRAERAGARIAEVPVVVEEAREARSSLLRRVPRTLRGLLQLRRRFALEASRDRRNTTSR